jgi:selenocysteine-specific translation elongation factor
LITDKRKLNKIIKETAKFFSEQNIPVYFISAVQGAGIDELKNELNLILNKKNIAV